MVKKAEYIEQMNQLYKTPSVPQVSTELESSTMSPQIPIDPLPSTSNPATSLCPPSPFSFSPRLHHILGRSRYVPTENEDPRNEGILEGRDNYRSDLTGTPIGNVPADNSGTASIGVQEGSGHEETHDYYDENQAPSLLEYSDGETGQTKEMVVSDKDDEEEVDELNLSEYEGFLMAGMLVNTDSGGYYEKNVDDMDVADDTASMDMDVGMSAAAMDDELLEDRMGVFGIKMAEDEIPVEMEVDGETCLFSRAAIAELHLLRENARLRGEEMDEEPEEFSEEQEYGDMISTVVVQSAPVAGPSQLRRGRTGGNSKYFLFFILLWFRKFSSWS
jgi:hypothetical protein